MKLCAVLTVVQPPGLSVSGTPSCGGNPALLSAVVSALSAISASLKSFLGNVSFRLPFKTQEFSLDSTLQELSWPLLIPSSCFIFFIEFRLFEIMFYKVSLSTLLRKVCNVKMLPSFDSPVSQTMSYSVSFQKTADEWKKIRKNLL